MDSEIESFLEDAKSTCDVLFESQFQLSDIGLNSKMAFDWSRLGIYLRERKSKYRRSYNGIEYVWLRLVKELRGFGLPIKSIQNVKDFLLTELDLEEYFTTIFEQEDLKDENWNELIEGLKSVFSTTEKLEAVVRDKKVNLLQTRLSVIIFSNILAKSDAHLLVTKQGDCLICDESPMEDRFNSSHILNEPYISIPLNYIIQDFIERENLYELDLSDNGVNLTEQEKKVLTLIRKGDISSLTVRFNGDTINLIETEENIDFKEVKGKLVDLIQRNSYHEITYKTENGKIVSLKRKTKHK